MKDVEAKYELESDDKVYNSLYEASQQGWRTHVVWTLLHAYRIKQDKVKLRALILAADGHLRAAFPKATGPEHYGLPKPIVEKIKAFL